MPVKRLFFITVCFVITLLLAGTAFAFRPYVYTVPSAEISNSGSVVSSAGYLYGLMVITDGTTALELDLYDSSSTVASTAAAATHLIPEWLVTTSGTDRMQQLPFNPPLAYDNGIYASGTTVGNAGTYNIIFYYREK